MDSNAEREISNPVSSGRLNSGALSPVFSKLCDFSYFKRYLSELVHHTV
ncbi:uncharacterized protein METZ01_LOCUS116730, partial [marine metagenome]